MLACLGILGYGPKRESPKPLNFNRVKVGKV